MDRKVLDIFRGISEAAEVHIVDSIRRLAPESVHFSDNLCKTLYNESIRIFQSQKNKGGKKLENVIEDILSEYDIPFLSQAYVDEGTGNITTGQKPKNCYQPDIIPFAKEGDNMRDHIYISIKRSLRERWRQDANKPCKSVYLITFDNVSPNMRNRMRSLNLIPIVVGDQVYNMEYLIEELEKMKMKVTEETNT